MESKSQASSKAGDQWYLKRTQRDAQGTFLDFFSIFVVFLFFSLQQIENVVFSQVKSAYLGKLGKLVLGHMQLCISWEQKVSGWRGLDAAASLLLVPS